MSSRNEEILKSCVEGGDCTFKPKSRLEALLFALKEKINASGNTGGGGGASGGGIIDVTELPTTNINDNALYRIIIPTFYMDGWAQSTTVHIVNGLPTSGEPFTLDGKTLQTAYYNNNDGALYFYVTEDLAAMGLPVGWLTAEQIAQIFDTMLAGGAGVITYGGVVETQDDVVGNPYMYLLLSRPLYFYKNGKWREVATEGASLILKTKSFTSLQEMIEFCNKKEALIIRGDFRCTIDGIAGYYDIHSQAVQAYKNNTGDGFSLNLTIETQAIGSGRFAVWFEANYNQDGILIEIKSGGIREIYDYQNTNGDLTPVGFIFDKITFVELGGAITVQYFA